MEKNADEVALLVAQTGPLNGRRWALRHSMLVGREPDCDIVVNDRQVSRHHARFTPSPRGIMLDDLGSKNGTHCNGQQVRETVLLQDGDIIQIALAQKFSFLSSDATVPLDADELDFQLAAASNEPITPEGTPESKGYRLHLEKRSRRVWLNEKEVVPPLSVSQFRLLELLFEQQGKVVSRQTLIAEVWGEAQAVEVSEQALDALIRRLRDRLASIDPAHAYIVTVRGHGLRLDNPSAD
jgi:hypothetical protein